MAIKRVPKKIWAATPTYTEIRDNRDLMMYAQIYKDMARVFEYMSLFLYTKQSIQNGLLPEMIATVQKSLEDKWKRLGNSERELLLSLGYSDELS